MAFASGRWAGGFGLALVAACVSTAGLSGGQKGGGPDAATSDATGESSALADAGGGGDAAPRTWCSLRDGDVLCDDFDRAPLGSLWNTVFNVEDGGTIAIESDAYVSPPHSLFLYSGGTLGDAVGLEKILAAAVQIRCEFEIWVDLTGGLQSDVFKLTVDAPDFTYYELSLSVSGTSSAFTELAQFPDSESNFTHSHPLTLIPPGQWTAVSVVIVLPGQATIQIGNDPPVPLPLAGPHDQTGEEVGIAAVGSMSAASALFDNVACQTSP